MTRRQLIAALLAGPLPMGARPIVSQSDDFTTLSVAAAAARIAAGTLSAVDLVEAYLARIGRIDPEIHAFITVTADRARLDARRAAPGLLRGIPIAHKDLFETAGIRTTGGSRLFESHVPARDADAVQRLTRAGAVMLGKTNTHELGGGVTTINPFFGTTRNPADPLENSWWIERRIGGRRRGSLVRRGDRQRYRWQRPHSCRALRGRRVHPDVRTSEHIGTAGRVSDVRSRRRAHPHRRGCRARRPRDDG